MEKGSLIPAALAQNRPVGGAFSAQGPQLGTQLPGPHTHGGGGEGHGMGGVQKSD